MLRRPIACLGILLLALFVAACGSDDDGGSDGGSSKGGPGSGVDTPAPLEAGGDFVVCTDVPYPPAEFQEGQEFKGYEVEMMEEVADRLGTTAVFQKTGFDGIIGALQAKKCDAIVSSMNVTPEREQQVAFVEYMTIGQAVAVPPDAEGTVDELADLAGQTVAVQIGTTLKALIDDENEELDDPIEVQSFPDAGAAASALKTDKVDAFFADAPVVADYVNKDPDSFAIGGTQIDELPAGIALRTADTELQEAVQEAIDGMYADGSLEEIFAEWSVDEFLLEADDADDAAATTDDAAPTDEGVATDEPADADDSTDADA